MRCVEKKIDLLAKKKRIDLLIKKKRLWGIDQEDEKELESLLDDVIIEYYLIVDNIYIDFIDPLLYTDEMVDIKSLLFDVYGFDGGIFSKVKNRDIEFDQLSERLSELELQGISIFLESEYGQEVNELFKSISNMDIIDYIRQKSDIIKMVNEEVGEGVKIEENS